MQPDIPVSLSSPSLGLSQNRVLRNTYMMLGITMIPTVIGALLGVNTDFSWMALHPVMAPLLMLAVMMGLLFTVSRLRNSAGGIVALLGFTFVAGWFLGPMLQYALHLRNGGQLIATAAGGTGAIFFSLAAYATVSKRDFSFLGKFLFIGLVLLMLGSIANLFFQVPIASLTMSAVAVVLFSGYILYDVSNVVRGGETNYLMATVSIYLDIYNLFINLLNLLMAFSGERD